MNAQINDTTAHAFLFPGQGAQTVGMAADLLDAWPQARALFARASDLVGRDLAALVREGPEEELCRTDVSQVAIFLHSMAVLDAMTHIMGAPPAGAAAAGLSLGEYSALVFAGAIEREDALEVVVHRGRCMQAAAEAGRGGMLAVMGPDLETVEDLCGRAREGGILGAANWNAPTQTVVSGDLAALARFQSHAAAAGLRKIVPLKVAGAFHSPLMAPAAEVLRPVIEQLTIRSPRVPFIPNREGRFVSDPERIRHCLVTQVTGTVLWTPTVRNLAASGIDRALEIGPGRTVAGLVKRTVPAMTVTSVGTQSELGGFAPRSS